ncbi:hypothetical protein GALMADRAFT_215712 [Galerina marginata CBS 339.88]|uniref:Uncharacterized protein n=1 Tax=Galerina marginata (strain CBS 339.88) TaxID=685588 RepID=A0A067SEX7_GALM3|nr:hypothetical protein GALMADRAFT_215712 [Galerina marginata CBS 339.88]
MAVENEGGGRWMMTMLDAALRAVQRVQSCAEKSHRSRARPTRLKKGHSIISTFKSESTNVVSYQEHPFEDMRGDLIEPRRKILLVTNDECSNTPYFTVTDQQQPEACLKPGDAVGAVKAYQILNSIQVNSAIRVSNVNVAEGIAKLKYGT